MILVIDFFFMSGWGLAEISKNPKGILEKDNVLYPPKITEKPRIDGILHEDIWRTPPLKKDFISYEPLFGDKIPYETLVWMAYDNKNLYFAFRCFDPEPQKIKASKTGRDGMWWDDWVGMTLDPLGTKQTTYGLCVNPNGVQGDLLETTTMAADVSSNLTWESAGKITTSGYQVEICVPLASIQYKSGKEVKMGIMFRRRLNHLGMKGSWPQQKIDQTVFNRLKPVLLKGLNKKK